MGNKYLSVNVEPSHDGINALRRESRELASSLPAAMPGNQQGGCQLNPVMPAPSSSTSAARSCEESVPGFMTPLDGILIITAPTDWDKGKSERAP